MDREQPIVLASQHNQLEIAKVLLKHQADPNACSLFGGRPLHYAVEHDPPVLARLLLDNGAAIDAQTPTKVQPIHVAAEHDNSQAIYLLLDHGAAISALGEFGRTPLHYAACNGAVQAALALLRRGANPDMRDDQGHTTLYLSLAELPPKSSAVLGVLLQFGAQLDLHSAIALGQSQLLRNLLTAIPSLLQNEPNAADFLTAAVWAKNTELIGLLLALGLNPNSSGRDPLPLNAAVQGLSRQEYYPIVTLLLEHGANPYAKSSRRDVSPVGWARANDPELLALFNQYRPE
jgi:cytohesin